nr:hypothetical protein [Tanacetum cinerariifolium]
MSNMIDITPSSQPKSSQSTPRTNKGKEKVTDKPKRKLFPASIKVRHDLDALVLVPYEINGKMYKFIKEQIQAHLDKEEMIKKSAEEAKLFAMNKSELIKVVHEEASKFIIDPKTFESAKGSQEFKRIHDAEMKVLNIEHTQKTKKVLKLRKKRLD